MTKLVPISIAGRKWIQLSQLSSKHAKQFRSWLPVNSLKKIPFQGIELNECVDFSTYEYWFRSYQETSASHNVLDF
ncbi:hypothetical protein JYB64_04790 [Algoriphagus aestuarii]|nr:hypothetical protein [Algoriphagus aestuarii]